MKNQFLIGLFAVLSAFTSNASNCYSTSETVTLTGVLVENATYVSPEDFGWAPANGFVPYTTIVLDQALCVKDGEVSEYGQHVLQVASSLTPQIPAGGKKVKVTGYLFTEHTSHHFTPVLISVQSFSEAN